MLDNIIEWAVWAFMISIWVLPLLKSIWLAVAAMLRPLLLPVIKLATSGLIGFSIVGVMVAVLVVILYKLSVKYSAAVTTNVPDSFIRTAPINHRY